MGSHATRRKSKEIVPAARELRAYFEMPGAMKQRALAGELEVDEQTVWTWKVGTRRATEKYREAIALLTVIRDGSGEVVFAGVAEESWLTRTERRVRQKLARLRAA